MTLTPIVGPTPGEDPAFDQQQLYLRGLESLRQLAGRTWTDHNVHDPGITILELLCYALTDLAYRASFPVEDLLATASDNEASMRRQFASARLALPMRPLTQFDYRKLLIDLPGVRNAWIVPEPVRYFADLRRGALVRGGAPGPLMRAVDLRGLHRALLEFTDDITPEGEMAVRAQAMARLQASRSLCDDFVAVDGVSRQRFRLCGELELAPEADTARVMADVLDAVQQYLAPPVHNYTLDEMLTRRGADGVLYTAPDVFAGPALDCGFIDDVELAAAELRTEIRLSDVISVVMDVPGVIAVRDLLINDVAQAVPLETRWVVGVEAGRQPTLDAAAARLVLYKRRMPVVPDPAQVEVHRRRTADAQRAKLETPTREDLPVPTGRFRGTGAFHSFQNHFPVVYGLGDAGVPGDGAEAERQRRRALAWQLKGYLLFFDQVMANDCAQLAGLTELFSTDPAAHTYFSQVVDSFRDAPEIYRTAAGTPVERLADARALVASAVEASVGADALTDRRQRFLDHLIARVGERFGEYVGITRSLFGATDASLVADRCEFLRDHAEVGAMRALGSDHTRSEPAERWDTTNVTGLERRVARLLGLANASRHTLSAVTPGSDVEVSGTEADRFGFLLRHRASGTVLLQSPAVYATEAAARLALVHALELGQLRSGYVHTGADAAHGADVVTGDGEVLASTAAFDSAPDRDAAVAATVDYLNAFYSREGLFVVESILLRLDEGEPQLPICVDPNCVGCEDDDPYSYRVHVVLPAYAGRFRQMEFRTFAEEVVREEMPAHVLPKVCWVSERDMARFEAAYQGWLAAPTEDGAERLARLEAFTAVLFSLKNVYPAQRLAACAAPETQPKFILGRTALGSAPGDDQ